MEGMNFEELWFGNVMARMDRQSDLALHDNRMITASIAAKILGATYPQSSAENNAAIVTPATTANASQ